MKELIEQLRCDADVFQNIKQGGFACYLVAKRYNDAADALEKMEAENAQLRRERDAALVDMQECDGSCEFCKWYDKEGCHPPRPCILFDAWEWRGVQNHIAEPVKGVQEDKT